jgi:hypothetical protein
MSNKLVKTFSPSQGLASASACCCISSVLSVCLSCIDHGAACLLLLCIAAAQLVSQCLLRLLLFARMRTTSPACQSNSSPNCGGDSSRTRCQVRRSGGASRRRARGSGCSAAAGGAAAGRGAQALVVVNGGLLLLDALTVPAVVAKPCWDTSASCRRCEKGCRVTIACVGTREASLP